MENDTPIIEIEQQVGGIGVGVALCFGEDGQPNGVMIRVTAEEDIRAGESRAISIGVDGALTMAHTLLGAMIDISPSAKLDMNLSKRSALADVERMLGTGQARKLAL